MGKISRRTWSLAVGAAVAGALYGCQSSQVEKTVESAVFRVYVSPSGNDSWSGTLAAANTAVSDGPVASVHRALEIVRSWRKVQVGHALTACIVLRGGTYELKNSIVIEPEDSGTAEAPLVITAYPGETPIISGGVTVKGWNLRKDGLWEADAPETMSAVTLNQFFVQGRRQDRPRLPHKNWYYMADQVERQKFRLQAFRFEKGEFNPNWYALKDVEVVSFDIWTTERQWVESVDPKTDTVYLQDNGNVMRIEEFETRQRFYIDNVREGLNEPGQWYFDRAKKKILYKPAPGQNRDGFSAVVPIIRQLFEFKGAPEHNAYVEHVTIKGLSLQHSACVVSHVTFANDPQSATNGLVGTILGHGVKNVGILGCEICHGGEHAVRFIGASERVTVQRCHIHDMGGGGVYLGVAVMVEDYYKLPIAVRFTDRCVVDNNFIHDSGKIFAEACGIWVGHASDNRISHNVIANLYYTGISVGWEYVTQHAPDPAVRNMVEYNRIYNLGNGVLSDGGGIYLLGVSPGTVVRNNWVSDMIPPLPYNPARNFNGLYLDSGSSLIRVENNIVQNVASGKGLLVNQGLNNLVLNNIFNRVEGMWLLPKIGSDGKLIPFDTTFERNIVVVTGDNVWTSALPASIAAGCRFRDNVYWSSRESAPTIHGDSIKEWLGTGQDVGSLAAAPGLQTVDGFICAEAGSPAERVGFRPIDTGNIGLYGSAAWRALPGAIKPLPIAGPRLWPNPVSEPVHTIFQKPGAAIYGLTTTGIGNGIVGSTPITGRPALRFGPHAVAYSFYQPWIRRSDLKLRFSILMPAHIGTTLCAELRDGRNNPYITGPSVVFGPSGGVVANGVPVAAIPLNKWVDVRIRYDYRAGISGRQYQIGLSLAGKELASRKIPIPGAAKFSTLTWLGFINEGKIGQECYIGYVDCGSIKR